MLKMEIFDFVFFFRYQTEMLQKMNKELEENLRVCLTLLKLVRGSVLSQDEDYDSSGEHYRPLEAIEY